MNYRVRATEARPVADAIAAMLAHTEAALGPVDILINNAGLAITRGLDDLTEAEFDRTIAVNPKSVFLCTRAVLMAIGSAYMTGQTIPLSGGTHFN